MPDKPERADKLYKKNSQLNGLYHRSQQLDLLNTILLQCLPEHMRDHAQLANITENKLIVHCDGSTIATMLRFQSKQICRSVSESSRLNIQSLEVKVRPSSETTRSPKRNRLVLSKKSAILLNNIADDMGDEKLRIALKKLAKRQSS